MGAITTSTGFVQQVSNEVFSKVKGHSAIAKLCPSMPVPFSGIDIFTFSLDSEIAIVAEGDNKPAGNATIGPKTCKPLKVVYQHRLTDEFLKCSEEKALPMLTEFTDGFAKKIAKGFDIMAFHGLNPATMTAATGTIGDNHFDHITAITSTADAEDDIETAAAAIGDYDVTGIAISKAFGADLAKIKANGVRQYPEFRMGANPGALNGIPCDVNATVSAAATGDTADSFILGDWSAFRWGFAENMPMEVIEYGDPDGQGDLKRKNQVVLRAEAYIGWVILDEGAFARREAYTAAATTEETTDGEGEGSGT